MSKDSPTKGIPMRIKEQKRFGTGSIGKPLVNTLAPNVNVETKPTHSTAADLTNLPSAGIGSDVEFSKAENTNPTTVKTQALEEVSLEPASGEFANGDKGKRKTPPLTMEEFIFQAYSRKGQRVGLKPNQEKSLSANHKLDKDAFVRLLVLAKQDRLLQVPRQLLLTARKIQSYPLPKKVLIEFIHAVLQDHPIFKLEHLRNILEDDKKIPPLYSLYQSIKSYNPLFKITDEYLEKEDLEKLKINTLNLMTAWLFYERNVRIDELVAVLLQVIWKPAADKLETDSQVIRALTELDELEAIGWVAERYLKNVVEAQDAAERAHRDAVNFRSEATSLRASLDLEVERSKGLMEQLDALQLAKDAAVKALETQNKVTTIHLSNDLEVMRGRLVESLQTSIQQLETGLSALNREVPRVQVMTQRAELVIENLKSELKELGGEV